MLLGVGPPGRASGCGTGVPATGGSPGAPGTAGRGAGGTGRLVNGLLPGPRGTLRGPPGRPGTPGRGAPGASGVEGAGPAGGAAAGGAAGAAGAAWAAGANAGGTAGAAGACGPGRGAGDRPGVGATGVTAPPAAGEAAGADLGAAGATGAAVVVWGAAGAAAFGAGPGLAAAGAGAPDSPNDSLNLRTTGGSTVDDADFTNSPRSLSFARTVLLSTPSSLASSWTRAFPATVLLYLGPRLPARPAITAWGYSSLSAHRTSIRQTHFRTAAVTTAAIQGSPGASGPDRLRG